ncbi:hypothetical protein [Methylocystis parvus]|uniref:hypothetical protein n=1 Tax=Methylocystis parvus TaxID=134 RepID=UPI003C78B810
MNRRTFYLAAIAAFAVTTASAADAPGGVGALSAGAPPPTQLSADQRGAIVRELVSKFQDQVQKTPHGDVRAWSSKLLKAAAAADAANLLRATTAPSLETMHAALNGATINSLASSSLSVAAPAAEQPALLGSTIADTTYTPLPNGRCRIADSRVITSPLTPNVARQIDVEDISSYAAQGGTGTLANGDGSANCGIPSFTTALVVSVTVLDPAGSGVVKVFGADQSYQQGNSILVTAGSFGATSDLIVRSCQSCALELAIQSTVAVNYTMNVIGYFMPPQATALECVNTAATITAVPAGAVANSAAPACAAGYTQTATNCESSIWQMPFVFFNGGTCSAQNNSSGAAQIRSSRTCCRVPGR